MRQINLPLNKAKLETKKLQLAQIETQLKAVKAKLDEVSERYNAKQVEVSELDKLISEFESPKAVS